ncbi:MAG TPA: hypothetical protein VHU86_08245 [Solirubrobacterales bacterium]|jgi:hypothetical protein|nr:hypothetical protein [Solirubrobacterales bacterium]
MSERPSRIIRFTVGALVLLAASTASVASAGKQIEPRLGLYKGNVVGKPEEGNVTVEEAEVKVLNQGRGRGAEFGYKISATCTKGFPPVGFSLIEHNPIPIRNGKFTFDRTKHERVAAGLGTATTKIIVSGTFKSATQVVMRVSVTSAISVQYSGEPETTGTCTGGQTFTVKHV